MRKKMYEVTLTVMMHSWGHGSPGLCMPEEEAAWRE